jgi:hypothetical protein
LCTFHIDGIHAHPLQKDSEEFIFKELSDLLYVEAVFVWSSRAQVDQGTLQMLAGLIVKHNGGG